MLSMNGIYVVVCTQSVKKHGEKKCVYRRREAIGWEQKGAKKERWLTPLLPNRPRRHHPRPL
jgi:hypothetical protein